MIPSRVKFVAFILTPRQASRRGRSARNFLNFDVYLLNYYYYNYYYYNNYYYKNATTKMHSE